jgi:hypothetical protein
MKLLAHRSTRSIGLAAATAATLAVGAASATAAPTGPYAIFSQCPTGNPDVSVCVVSDTTSGAIKLGNQNVPINKRIRLQGGLRFDPETFESVFVPAKNGQTLEQTSLNVPGGLLGITVPSALPQPARGLLEAAINTVNGVKATAQLVGPVGFNFNNLLSGQGIAVELPLRVKLDNPFLGNNCYIGSASAPVRLRLTNGTTTPPAGTAPMVGSPGVLGATGDITTVTGQSLVDNTFSVPRASGCGGLLAPLINPVVDLKVGLPAAAGVSTARLNGDAQIGDAALVKASEN